MTRKRWRPSLMVSDEVGSSRMSSLSSCDRPLAISTICCWPGDSCATGVRGSMSTSRSARMRRVPSYIGARRMTPSGVDRLAAGIDVLGHAQRAHQAALLVDHGDTGVGGALLVEARDRHAVELDRAAVRLVDAGDEVHERGLAGAVLADQRVHLAAPDLEGDVVDGTDAGKGLDHVAHGQARRSGRQLLAALLGPLGGDLRPHRHLESRLACGPGACAMLAGSGAFPCMPFILRRL